ARPRPWSSCAAGFAAGIREVCDTWRVPANASCGAALQRAAYSSGQIRQRPLMMHMSIAQRAAETPGSVALFSVREEASAAVAPPGKPARNTAATITFFFVIGISRRLPALSMLVLHHTACELPLSIH